ncbi:hypothetical protein ACWCQZ_47530 [Streptomyces sp. NPDC002285]
MTSDPVEPRDHAWRRQHIRNVCCELVEREAAARGMTHDDFVQGLGLIPELYLRAIIAGLGQEGGTHDVTVYLDHEQDDHLWALLVVGGGRFNGEFDEMGRLIVAARTIAEGGVITARTKQDGGRGFRAWVLVDGRPEPVMAEEAREVAEAYDGRTAYAFADAFEPELHLHRIIRR